MLALYLSTETPLPTAIQWGVAGAVLLVMCTLASRSRDCDGGAKKPLKPRKIHRLGTRIPLVGDLIEVSRNAHRKHDMMLAMCLRFKGEPWQVHILGMPTFVNISDPRVIEEITTTQFDNFAKGPFQIGVLADLLGTGIVASDGERWYHQRKTAAKFFSARSLRECMTQTMQRNMTLVCRLLEEHAENKLVNLSQLFHQFTLQTFASAGLGVEIPLIGEKQPNSFEEAMDAAMPIVSRRGRLPPFVWKFERWMGIGQEKILADSMKIIRGWLRETIDHSLKAIKKRPEDCQDTHGSKSIVALFAENSHEDRAGMRAEDLVDFILNFVFAARDTSALALIWFFYSLSTNPSVEASIRAELSRNVSRDAEYITADDVKKLTYLEATIKETLRLYPGAPNTVKQVMRDTVICGDIFLRKGQMIGISAYVLARNPLVWGPDAAEFKPERWIDATTGKIIQAPSTKFFSFHAGPRSCVGMKLAMLNLRAVTANLLHRFQFEVDPANDGCYINAPTMAMKHPLLAAVKLVQSA